MKKQKPIEKVEKYVRKQLFGNVFLLIRAKEPTSSIDAEIWLENCGMYA